MSEIKIPEQVNQTFIGLAIGLVGIYYSLKIDFSFVFKISVITILAIYSMYILVLSAIQMCKNTTRYLSKERLDGVKFSHEKEILNLKGINLKIEQENLDKKIKLKELKNNNGKNN